MPGNADAIIRAAIVENGVAEIHTVARGKAPLAGGARAHGEGCRREPVDRRITGWSLQGDAR